VLSSNSLVNKASQPPLKVKPTSNSNNKRKALIIGVQHYRDKGAILDNTLSDARAMRDMLARMGYDVSEYYAEDKTTDELQLLIHRYEKNIKAGDYSIVYYAGHAFQDNSSNYITGVDVDVGELKKGINKSIAIMPVMEQIAIKKPAANILLLDGCRTWWNQDKRGLVRLESSDAGVGHYFVMAAQPGHEAYDGGKGAHGIFTQAILNHLYESKDFDSILAEITKEVNDVSGKNQLPEITYSPSETPVFLLDGSRLHGPVSGSVPASSVKNENSAKNEVCSNYQNINDPQYQRGYVDCLMAEINLRANQLAALREYEAGTLVEKTNLYRNNLLASGLIGERISQMWSQPARFIFNLLLTFLITALLMSGELLRYLSPRAVSEIRAYELQRYENARLGLKNNHFKNNEGIESCLKRAQKSISNFGLSTYEAWDPINGFYRDIADPAQEKSQVDSDLPAYKRFLDALK
jgi:hypothetical protein